MGMLIFKTRQSNMCLVFIDMTVDVSLCNSVFLLCPT